MATGTATSERPKIKLYWLEESRSQRVLWILEELNISYELEVFYRNKETMLAGPELTKVHALGKFPVISITTADSADPIVIAESAFIVEYLLDHFGDGSTLLPKRYKEGQEGKIGGETEEWMRYRYFMHYAEGSLMSLMLMALVVRRIQNAPVPFFLKLITNGIASKMHSGYLDPSFKTHFTFLEEQLKTSPDNGPYLCGPRLTGADVMLSFPLIAGKDRAGLTQEAYPKLWDYVARLKAEPGYVKAGEKMAEMGESVEPTF